MSPIHPTQTYQFDRATLLGQIDQDSLAGLIGKAMIIKVPKRKVILEENSDNQNMYFILTGRVRASYISEDGKEITSTLEALDKLCAK